MFAMKNFVMPMDPHSSNSQAKDIPTIVFKPKKEKMEKSEIKPERRAEQVPKSAVIEKKEENPRVAEAQEKSIPVEKAIEQAPKSMNEVPKVGGSKGPKKIRFEKGSKEAAEWGKEMSLRRKLKKEGTMKEKVVEVKPMTETIIAESVKPIA